MKRYTYLPYLWVIAIFFMYTQTSYAQMPGSIPGTLSATGTGAATYTIPIECPQGVGVVPNISLVYSSQSGKGIAGWGWSLAGLSTITRTSQTTYFDNVSVNKDVTFTKNDPLLYNGRRLFLDPDSVNVYRLEGDPSVLVKAYSVQSWGPAYLKVFTKEGLTMTFGKTNDPTSYLQVYDNAGTQTNPVKVGWNLVEVEDANGNYMTISYINTLGTIKGNAVRQITFGKNKRIQSTNALTIFFDYEQRPDEMRGYVVGKESLQQLRLKTISTAVNGTTQKEYRLSYQNTSLFASGISRLSSIDLYNRGVKLLNPLTFTYGDGKDGENDISLNASQWHEYYNPSIGFVAIDANGDGYCELGEYYSKEENGTTNAYLNIRNYSRNWAIERSIQTGTHDWDSDAPIHLYGDFNGNGTTDHVRLTHTGDISSGNVRQDVGIQITDLSTGTTFFNRSSILNTKKAPFLSVGKCNGLPFSSLMVLSKEMENHVGWRYFYQIISRTESNTEPSVYGVSDFTVPYQIDGMEVVKLGNVEYYDDLFLKLNNGTTRIIVNNQAGSHKYTDKIKNPNLNIGKDDYHQFVDFNGDGLTDIVYRKKENNQSVWRVALNKGNYTFEVQELSFISNQENIFRSPNIINYQDQDMLYFVDINQDGLIDILSGDEQLTFTPYRINNELHYIYDFYRTSWTLYINTGSGFQSSSGGISYAKANRSCLGDLLGNGKISWLYSNSYGDIVIRNFGYNPNQNRLTAITNPAVGTISLEYQPQTDNELTIPNRTDNGNVLTDQEHILLGYLPFKSSASHVFAGFDDGNSKYAYRYGKPLVNWKYRGYTGYRYIEKRDVKTDIAELTVNGFPSSGRSFYLMLPLFKWTYKGNNYNDSVISKQTYEYAVKSYTNQKGRYALQPSKTVTKGYLAGETTVTQVYESYDDWNNMLTGYTESYGQKERHVYTYGTYGSWCNSKITKDIQTTTSLTDGTSLVRTSVFTFDSRGNPTESKKDDGNTNMVTTRYKNYNIYGYPLQVEEVVGTETRTTNYTYTTSGRFIASETNPLGETISYLWNEEKGLVTASTNRTGTTLYTYNGSYDYLTKIKYPTGLIETHSFAWDATTPGGYYRQQSRADLPGSTIRTYYDKYGRETMTERNGPTGTKLYTYTEYYPDGRLRLTTKPSYMSRPLNVSYTYDKYGRVASIRTIQDSTTITYGSSNSSLATNYVEERTASGHITRKNWNTAGQLVTVTTDGKAVNFTYSVGNRLKTSTPVGGSSIQIQYDLQGNRTKLIDPDAGTITSSYNGWGQLRYQTQRTNSNHIVTTTYYYTPTGLLYFVSVQNLTTGEIEGTKYEYDTRNRLLKSYIVGGNHSISYEYDNYDRTTKSTETIKGQPFVFKYEYDTSNRVTKETYPTEYYINNTYLYGYLKKVTDIDNRVVWELATVNDGGEVLTEKKNGVTTTYTYDSFTQQISSIKATGIVDMNYTYYVPYTAKSANLKTYRDGISNQQETYTYDSMDRLVNWTTPADSYPFSKMAYSSAGNRITFKYDPLDFGNEYVYRSSTSNQIDYIDYTGANRPGGGFTHSAVQEIKYTDFNKVKSMTMDNQSCEIEYGVGQQRTYMKLNRERYNTVRYYAGKYERETHSETGVANKHHYIYGGNGLAAIYIIRNNVGTLYSTYTDRQGSLVALTNGSTVVQRTAFDPWGKRRNPSNWIQKESRDYYSYISSRGYTMHEHLDMYGLINMNARMYDPFTATFLSPDPQLQVPENWLNYNRYAYCLNNPLKYTDPTGEWFGIDDLLIAGVGFVFGYVGHGISTGNWGLDAVAAGGIGAGMAWLGYNTSGMASGAISNATWNHVGSMGINAVANQIMPSINIPMGDFGISISPSFGLGQSGLTGGANVSAYYSDGNVSIGGSIGVGTNYWGWNASATYKGWGGGYGETTYGASDVIGHQLGEQRLGTITANFNHNSVTVSNDMFGDNKDRWRTSAVELTVGKWSLGTYIYTNDGETASNHLIDDSPDAIPPFPVGRKSNGKLQTWENGQAYSAPLWIGYRNGNQITRVGYSHKIIHNSTQNMMHKFLDTPYYMNYENFRSGGYFYTGYRNPLSLYDY